MISQLEDMKRPKSSHDNFWTKFGNSGHSERSFLSIELELFFLATYYFFSWDSSWKPALRQKSHDYSL